jgi:benzoyl-CoA 2,3-dioxygenase component B
MAKGQEPRSEGAVPMELIQKYINLWFSLSLDLFGGEISSNAADFFAAGLKGRFREEGYEEHSGMGTYKMQTPAESGALFEQDVPLRNAMNEVLRDEYIKDCQRACDRWNKSIAKAGLSGVALKLPHRRFHRGVGPFAAVPCSPDGTLLSPEQYSAQQSAWLPTPEDFAYIRSLMQPVYARGQMANWIAPPAKGIDGRPLDFEYVRAPRA